MSKKFSDSTWRTIKLLIEAHWKPAEICKRVSGLTPSMIYSKVRTWKREEERKLKPENRKYYTPEYKAWRAAVFKRDGYRCRICKTKGTKRNPLQADHIFPWCNYPDLRFKVSNGKTLCLRHHKMTPTWGKKALNYRPK